MLNIGIAANVNGFPEFHDVVAWEKAAEVIGQYGRKGREIHVDGRITSRSSALCPIRRVQCGCRST
jgi:hypothetical protein